MTSLSHFPNLNQTPALGVSKQTGQDGADFTSNQQELTKVHPFLRVFRWIHFKNWVEFSVEEKTALSQPFPEQFGHHYILSPDQIEKKKLN